MSFEKFQQECNRLEEQYPNLDPSTIENFINQYDSAEQAAAAILRKRQRLARQYMSQDF